MQTFIRQVMIGMTVLATLAVYCPRCAAAEQCGFVTVELSGDVYVEYLHLTVNEARDKSRTGAKLGAKMAFGPIAARRLEDGRFSIHHSIEFSKNVNGGRTTHLITLDATVDSSSVKMSDSVKQDVVSYSFPNAKNFVSKHERAQSKSKQLTVELSDLKSVTLRMWKLEGSNGD